MRWEHIEVVFLTSPRSLTLSMNNNNPLEGSNFHCREALAQTLLSVYFHDACCVVHVVQATEYSFPRIGYPKIECVKSTFALSKLCTGC